MHLNTICHQWNASYIPSLVNSSASVDKTSNEEIPELSVPNQNLIILYKILSSIELLM